MVSAADWASFEEVGYLLLGAVASPAQLASLQNRIDAIMLGEMRYDGMYFQLDSDTGRYEDVGSGGGFAGPTLNYRKIEQLEKDPVFLAYMQRPEFREITQRVYGSEVSIYRAMFMNKPAQKGTVLPYHQDGGSQWGLTANPLITVWTALDDASRANGCMQVIPGSHKLGLLSERGHTITAQQEAELAPDDKSVYLEAREGEAILLHNWLLHRSGVNTISQSRRALSVCYMDAATRACGDSARSFPQLFGAGALGSVS
ncbi:MAG: phytanoyl-CoA dioxygenase family protein [Armatimonadetes bacterium]|nr:phytanoyl-CoA dioxygenase family protein [Armatimonadota bacterium]MDE2205708.1 phytanoyl-CoA dioxygenase family protein [Armatimonadota bacterium]